MGHRGERAGLGRGQRDVLNGYSSVRLGSGCDKYRFPIQNPGFNLQHPRGFIYLFIYFCFPNECHCLLLTAVLRVLV